ncbi:hypothetical protein C9374_000017 [Naegleria lovaniensis]|uniref:Attractin/MKLN-like beta-propeller domain-containing protein n=1 Tax=Naegleria lovaniensis TaxID=51637 RepID=A0AA88GY89_NAELO|nr:uncharacterized protein C9374_000017 [Naegleria lovaniensis]KAG2388578.1 hypothetical protein C9374_000017 [Naegleria lovaniensis]
MRPYKHVHLFRSAAANNSSSDGLSPKESNWFRPVAILPLEEDLARQDDDTEQQQQPMYKYSIGVSDSHVCITEGDLVYFWGGRNSTKGMIHIYDMSLNRWLPPIEAVSILVPQTRYYHGFVKQGKDPIFWLYGGVNQEAPNESQWTDEFYSFNLTTRMWYKHANGPSKLRGHIFLYRKSNHSLLLYSGNDSYSTNEMYEYNISKCTWKKIFQKNYISARAYASGNIVYNQGKELLIVYGGDVGVGAQELSDELCIYDFADQKWRIVDLMGTSIPPPLFGHANSTCQISPTELLIYGGCDDQYIPYSHCFIFNFVTEQWKAINVTNIKALNCSSMFIDKKRGKIHLYGGYDSGSRSDTFMTIEMNTILNYRCLRAFPNLFSALIRDNLTDISIVAHDIYYMHD